MTTKEEAVAALARIRNQLDALMNLPRHDRASDVDVRLARLRSVISEETETFKNRRDPEKRPDGCCGVAVGRNACYDCPVR